jgi:hypothetical protein
MNSSRGFIAALAGGCGLTLAPYPLARFGRGGRGFRYVKVPILPNPSFPVGNKGQERNRGEPGAHGTEG